MNRDTRDYNVKLLLDVANKICNSSIDTKCNHIFCVKKNSTAPAGFEPVTSGFWTSDALTNRATKVPPTSVEYFNSFLTSYGDGCRLHILTRPSTVKKEIENELKIKRKLILIVNKIEHCQSNKSFLVTSSFHFSLIVGGLLSSIIALYDHCNF